MNVRFTPCFFTRAAWVVLAFAGTQCGSPSNGFSGSDGGRADSGPSLGDAGLRLGTDAKTGPPVNVCKVGASGDGPVPTCTQQAPPNSFSAKTKWTWSAPVNTGVEFSYQGSIVTPLVGHFVDTNHDGAVDLCDTPSVVVATGG